MMIGEIASPQQGERGAGALRNELDLGAIRAFVAVAQTGGFSSGARAVGLTRSAVGKALARLEGNLGVRLLNRTTRKLSLTGDGKAFYERCRQILNDLQEAEADIRQDRPEPKGLLRLTLPDTFGRQQVLPILSDYLKAWPKLTAEVSITDRIADVVEEGYDLAVRCGGQLSDTRLIARAISRCSAVVCAAPEYLVACGEPHTADDLLGHSRLTLGNRGIVRAWPLTPPGGEPLRITEAGRVRLDNGEALRQAALAGLGLAYLPSFLVGADIAAGRLRAILTDHETEEVIVHALYPSRRHLSSKVRMLIDQLAAQLGQL